MMQATTEGRCLIAGGCDASADGGGGWTLSGPHAFQSAQRGLRHG